MAAAKQKVRIAPNHSVLLGDGYAEAGEIVEVSSADAKVLLGEGYAVDPTAPVEVVSEEKDDSGLVIFNAENPERGPA